MLSINWREIDSSSINGLIISELPPITKPKMRTNIIKIDGRDGDLIEELGYESYTKTIKIGLAKNYDIDEIIKYFTGYGDLILSNEPDKVYRCSIMDKIDYEKLLRFKKASVKFYTQPYKYKRDEEKVVLNIDQETSVSVSNIGLEKSKPIIKLQGSGTVAINLNGATVFNYTFPSNENEVVIDSIKEEAYLNNIFKNRHMSGIFPILELGENTISWSGDLTKIEIQPMSRWL